MVTWTHQQSSLTMIINYQEQCKHHEVLEENNSGCFDQPAGHWKGHLASQDRMEMVRQLSCLPAPGIIWLFVFVKVVFVFVVVLSPVFSDFSNW